MLAATLIKRVYKPILFIACLAPLALLMARAFGVGGLSLGANPVEELLHQLGLWSLRFLAMTLAVTPLKDIVRKPWPLAYRRMLGLYAFFYTLLHFVTWFWLDQQMNWPSMLKDIAKRPFITIGVTAFLMLIPLAITSTNGMIRRLGARRWRTLHRLIYVVAILGVWHFYWLVKADVREPLTYAAILGALFGWRLWRARPRLS